MNPFENPALWVIFGLVALAIAVRWFFDKRRNRKPDTKYTGWQDNPKSNRNTWARGVPETDSPIEERLLEAMRALDGLPEPQLQFEIHRNGRRFTIPDMAYPEQKIAIFCDSKKFHAEIGQLIDDAHKRNYLSMNGWVVLVYWGPEINRDAQACAMSIRDAYRLNA